MLQIFKEEEGGIFFQNIFPALKLPVKLLWNHWLICVGFLAINVCHLVLSATFSRKRGEKRGQTSLIAEAHWRWGCCRPQIGPGIPPAHLVGIHEKIRWNQVHVLKSMNLNNRNGSKNCGSDPKKSRIRTTFRSRNSPVSRSLSFSFYSFLHGYPCTNSICIGSGFANLWS